MGAGRSKEGSSYTLFENKDFEELLCRKLGFSKEQYDRLVAWSRENVIVKYDQHLASYMALMREIGGTTINREKALEMIREVRQTAATEGKEALYFIDRRSSPFYVGSLAALAYVTNGPVFVTNRGCSFESDDDDDDDGLFLSMGFNDNWVDRYLRAQSDNFDKIADGGVYKNDISRRQFVLQYIAAFVGQAFGRWDETEGDLVPGLSKHLGAQLDRTE